MQKKSAEEVLKTMTELLLSYLEELYEYKDEEGQQFQ